jgi:hypothetical protein
VRQSEQAAGPKSRNINIMRCSYTHAGYTPALT